MEYKEVYESWLANPYFDEATKQELLSIKDDENEIKERFYADLEFGTAGLRGVIGAGTNRMNVYVVRKTTQGLANYIIKQNAADKGVAIAFDSRRMSTEFANEAALCLAANGIKAYIFDALRPTPELSFAVREPYPSINSGADIVMGKIKLGESLKLRSCMPENGVIFSDGMQEDAISFNSGTLVTITVAKKQGNLLVCS